MTVEYATPLTRGSRFGPRSLSQQLPLISTAVICVLLYVAASMRYTGFFAPQVLLNFFANSAWLGVAAVGLTFVILSGGIDLSVGSMIGFSSILAGLLVERYHWSGVAVVAFVLLVGSLYGVLNGILIHFFELAPFLVTLAGMFILRGAALWLGGATQRIALEHPLFVWPNEHSISLGGAQVRFIAVLFIVVAAVAAMMLRYTRFGRNVYAIGGSESSAVLMGLPVARTKVLIYMTSGFCSALAGLVFCFDLLSADPSAAIGLELDAIAAVVIGGTLLSGGVGSVIGTVLGVVIISIIQTSTDFENLLSWWRQIVTGSLLLVFIALQKLLMRAQPNR
jgi:ribose/xylose/arabinose/galactoside ABC-type transport system permease subunit